MTPLAINQLVYFKDDPSLPEHSSPSQGASLIISRSWDINGVVFDSDNNDNPFTPLPEASNNVTLTIEDDLGRTASKTHTIGAELPLPEYKEIIPPFIWLKKAFAGVIDFLNGFMK